MITRWLLELNECTFSFQHIFGKLNILADYLSCIPVQHNSTILNQEPNLTFFNDTLPIVCVNNCENNQHECVNATITNSNNIPDDPPLKISVGTIKFH